MEAGEYSYFTGLPCKRGHVAARRTHNSSCLGCYPGKQREQQVVSDRISNELARRKAVKAGKRFYFASPCKYGHIGKRLTSNTSCSECNNKYRQDNLTAIAKRNVEWKSKNPEKVRKHRKGQYLRHREEIRLKKKIWYQANAEKQISYSKKWLRENPERRDAYRRVYDQKHKERDKKRRYENVARWRRNNPEFVRSRRAHRRALKRGAEGDHSISDLDVLFKWQNGKCSYCSSPFINKKYSIDHIQPLHNGGSDWPENLQLLCKSCNCKKSWADPFVFLLKFSEAVQKRWLLRLRLRQDLLIKALSATKWS
jgi:5-methylcytosine-specific restriction endonuclease McrA